MSVHSIKSLNAFRINDTIVITCYLYNMDIFLVFCCDFNPVAYYASYRPIRLLIFFELTISAIWLVERKRINPVSHISHVKYDRVFISMPVLFEQHLAFSLESSKCHLCLTEKFEIANFHDPAKLLNKRSEVISKCRHQRRFKLASFDTGDWRHRKNEDIIL